MTDTVLICESRERIAAHCVVLATHWVWGYLMRELEGKGKELVIVMDRYTKTDVKRWVGEAYDNIDINAQLFLKSENENCFDEEDVKYEYASESNDVDEYEKSEENIDDSVVNVAEYFDLENLVKQQIALDQNNCVIDLSQLKRKVIKDDLFNTCVKALEASVEHCREKVRGLPLHGFVFTDYNILEAARAQVRQEKVEKKSKTGKGRVTKVSTYSCKVSECDFTSDESSNAVIRHVMSSHMEVKGFKCKDCGNTFTVRDRAYSHIKREHVDRTIKKLIKENLKIDSTCKICGLVYKGLYGLRDHIKKIHDKQTDVKCPECPFVSKDYLEVGKHRRDEHGFGHRACHICGKQFSSRVGYDHHVANTHGTGSLPCENCGEIFRTKRALDDHRKRKHLERKCVCDDCGAKFHTPFEVKKHKKCHGDEYPYQCNLCGKRCREAVQLKQHMYKHTGERPFHCKQCDARFNQSNALYRHNKVVHSGIRAFPCDLCSFKGGQAFDLVRHMKSVHNIDTGMREPVLNSVQDIRDTVHIHQPVHSEKRQDISAISPRHDAHSSDSHISSAGRPNQNICF